MEYRKYLVIQSSCMERQNLRIVRVTNLCMLSLRGLEEAFGLEKITRAAVQKFNNKYDINANAFAALWRAAKICDRYFPPVSKLHNSRSNVRSRLGSKFLDALDDACMLGYAWANAEADHKMRPSALSALKAKDGAARGGHASGASRSAKAAETWQVTVRAEALRVRSEQTDISQEKLAAEILYKCGEGIFCRRTQLSSATYRNWNAKASYLAARSAGERPSDANANTLRVVGNMIQM